MTELEKLAMERSRIDHEIVDLIGQTSDYKSFADQAKEIVNECVSRNMDGCYSPTKCPYFEEDAYNLEFRDFAGVCMFVRCGMNEPHMWNIRKEIKS